MILDTLENSKRYSALHPGFKEGLAFLEKAVQENLPVGRYELNGSKLFALVQEYETKKEADAKWEAHKKYIDIQFVAAGTEVISWDSIKKLPAGEEYNAEKDRYLFAGPSATDLILEAGTFGIFYPEDLHKPGMEYKKTSSIKKVVVKVLAE